MINPALRALGCNGCKRREWVVQTAGSAVSRDFAPEFSGREEKCRHPAQNHTHAFIRNHIEKDLVLPREHAAQGRRKNEVRPRTVPPVRACRNISGQDAAVPKTAPPRIPQPNQPQNDERVRRCICNCNTTSARHRYSTHITWRTGKLPPGIQPAGANISCAVEKAHGQRNAPRPGYPPG